MQNLALDGADAMRPNTLDLYPMTHLKSKTCSWNLSVRKGMLAQVEFSKWRNWITAKETFDRATRQWKVVKCYDYFDIFEADGMTKIDTVCGRRSFRYKNKWTSASNKMIVVLHTDHRVYKRERAWFQVNQV